MEGSLDVVELNIFACLRNAGQCRCPRRQADAPSCRWIASVTAASARTAAQALVRWALGFRRRKAGEGLPVAFRSGLAQAAELVRTPAAMRTITASMCPLVAHAAQAA